MLVEEREDLAVPRRRGGVVIRDRDLPHGQDVMASKVNERRGESNGKEITTTKSEVTESPKGNMSNHNEDQPGRTEKKL